MKNLNLNQMHILNALIDHDQYGYSIVKIIRERTGRTLLLGSVYNCLNSLERKGYVKNYWSDDDKSMGGRRKYFNITPDGKSALHDALSSLNHILAFQ